MILTSTWSSTILPSRHRTAGFKSHLVWKSNFFHFKLGYANTSFFFFIGGGPSRAGVCTRQSRVGSIRKTTTDQSLFKIIIRLADKPGKTLPFVNYQIVTPRPVLNS